MEIFYIITLISMFFCGMYIPGIYIPVYTIMIGVALILSLIACPKHILGIFKYKKYIFFRILFFFIIWICFSGFLLVLNKKFDFSYYIYTVYMLFLYGNFTWYIFPYMVCPRKFSLKFIARFLVISIYCICLYGLVEFSLKILNINFIISIQNIILNRRIFENEYFSNDLMRLCSIFEEPGYLGGFVCINLPIIYNLIFSPFKLLKNKYLNYIIKKSYFIILVLTIICMQSPAWYLIFIVLTLIYFRKKIIENLRKIILLLFILIIPACFISKALYPQTFLIRITNTIESFGSIRKLYINERSLAIRIIAYYIRIKIFFKHPVTGVGYRNASTHSFTEYQTFDFYKKYKSEKTETNLIREINGAILWNLLSDTGIIGTILFYCFLINCAIKIDYIYKKLNYSIEKIFIQGIKNCYITIICLSVYDIRLNFIYLWFLFGITLSIIEYYNKIKIQKMQNLLSSC